MASVVGILRDLGLEETPVLLVWNKADAAEPEVTRALVDQHGGRAVSALTGEGAAGLLVALERELFRSALRARSAREAEANP